MDLRDRINHPDRRLTDADRTVERRANGEQRLATWMQRARDGALYGYGPDGKPVAGKSMDRGAA
jgi:hypothetical protein